jgi:hypothetical protein
MQILILSQPLHTYNPEFKGLVYRPGYAPVQPKWEDGTPRPLEQNDYGYYLPRPLVVDYDLHSVCNKVSRCV